MQAPPRTPPLGVVFDTSLDRIDQVLALSMLFGFEGTRRVRMSALSTSRFSLRRAAFLDLVARYFLTGRNVAPIGMSTAGTPSTV